MTMTNAVVSTLRKRPVPSRGKEYTTAYITIPYHLLRDSAFPFKLGEQVIIRIEGQGLRVEKFPEQKGSP